DATPAPLDLATSLPDLAAPDLTPTAPDLPMLDRAVAQDESIAPDATVALPDLTMALPDLAAMPADLTMLPDLTQLYTLTVSGCSGGNVTSSPAGIDCCGGGSQCSAMFAAGTVVMLMEMPDSKYAFTSWGGDCGGSGACGVTMDANHNVTASFNGPTD